MKSNLTKLKKQWLEWVMLWSKIKFVNKNGMGSCCTCNRKWHWTTMCGWHFIPQAKWNSCKFELDNINLQCNTCNWKANQWEQYKHWIYIDNTYWVGRAEKLYEQSRNLKKWKYEEIEIEMIYVANLISKWYCMQTKEQRLIFINYLNKPNRKALCKELVEYLTY